MSEPPIDASTWTFLQGLAKRSNTRVIVYVPIGGSPPYALWISDDIGDAEEVSAVEHLGRRWMSRLADGGQTDGPENSQVAYAALRTPDSGLLGALIAVKEAGDRWSAHEQDVLRLALDSYGSEIDHRRAAVNGSSAGRTFAGADLEAGIRNAVDQAELALVYQPEIDLLTRRVVAVEALVRWQHPLHGELGPESFISTAERSGLITVVGAWVIDAAAAALATWNAALPGLDVVLRVNVSPVQMHGAELVPLFRAAIERHKVRGTQLCIELTENAPLRDAAVVADTLRGLKELGVKSAIDDLAKGYSTLSQLRRLPVDIIKLDRSLVSGIDQDPRAEAIVTALIGLALNFGLEVVAEGVENEREVEALLRLGCTRAQGHHLGKPMHQDAVVELLRRRGNLTQRDEF